jgi:hypothetical protein
LFLELTDDTSYNKVADSHDYGARDKNGLSSPAVQINDGRNRCEEHDDTNNARCQQGCGVSSKVKTGKDERGVIQDEVDTCNQRLYKIGDSPVHCWKVMVNTATMVRLKFARLVMRLLY